MATTAVARKLVEFPSDDVDKFKKLYPAHGSLTWFLREALHNFVQLHEVKTEDLVKLAVSEVAL